MVGKGLELRFNDKHQPVLSGSGNEGSRQRAQVLRQDTSLSCSRSRLNPGGVAETQWKSRSVVEDEIKEVGPKELCRGL